jgi:2-methylcitrate dehydratase PrpD
MKREEMSVIQNQVTLTLADFINNLSFEKLPEDVVESAKMLVLDYLASAMAGYKVNRLFNDALVAAVVDGLGGRKESRVFFQRCKMPAASAALLNSAYGHGADLDDGHRLAQGHPGVTVIPVALSVAEAHKMSGRDAILAIVAGYDIFIRIAAAINPSHFSRGFNTTGTVGTIAAGVTAAKTLKLPLAGVRNTIGLAALQAAGLLEVTESGQMAKPLLPAKAAFNGIFSARLAEAGAEGPREALEGRKGFIKAFADQADMNILLKDLGKEFKISSCYSKPYPACRHTHAAIDAALNLRMKYFNSLKELEKVKVYIYPAAIKLTGSIYEPRNEDEAKFSLPYNVATALTKGHFTLQDLDVAKNFDIETRKLVSKTEIINDPQMESREANIRGARVELIMKNGTTRQAVVKLPKGEPEVPALKKDIETKLGFCAETLFREDRLRMIVRTVQELEGLKSVNRLTQLLVL